MNNYIFKESEFKSVPINIKSLGKGTDKVRFEAYIQSSDILNRNRRIYSKGVLQEGINKIMPRIMERSFLSELGHPNDASPVRQITVLYSNVSHLITELSWDNNLLRACMETVLTPSGKILSALIQDKIPVSFSMRGSGALSESRDAYGPIYKVESPLNIFAWDSVSLPSHSEAKLIKVTESVNNQILESINVDHIISESAGVICTEDPISGKQVCYLPNNFDNLVEQRKRMLLNKFK